MLPYMNTRGLALGDAVSFCASALALGNIVQQPQTSAAPCGIYATARWGDAATASTIKHSHGIAARRDVPAERLRER